MKKIILIFQFIFVVTIFAVEIEEIYYTLNINGKISDTFHKSIELEKEKYINLKRLLALLGIDNNKFEENIVKIDIGNIYTQESEIDIRKKYIKKRNKITKLENNDLIIQGNEIFITTSALKSLFEIEEIDFYEEKLIMNITINFKMPHQVKIENDYRRKELKITDEKTTEIINGKHKFFQPGNLGLNYNYSQTRSDTTYDNKYLDLQYTGDVLYGTLSSYYSIYPYYRQNKIQLIYENIIDQQSLIFGDMSFSLPTGLSRSNSIKGISFVDNYRSSILREKDDITFSGYSLTGKNVELYRGNKLIAFADITDGYYEFKNIQVFSYADNYTIKIYNNDGTVEVKEMKQMYQNNNLNKGKTAYNIYLGKNKSDNLDTLIYDLSTGITKNLTLNYGIYKSGYFNRGNEKENVKNIRLGLNYTSDFTDNPYVINTETIYDIERSEMSYQIDILKKFKKFTFRGFYENYGDNIAKYQNINSTSILGIDYDFDNFLNNVNLEYYVDKDYRKNKSEQIRLGNSFSYKDFLLDYKILRDIKENNNLYNIVIRNYSFENYYIEASSIYNQKYSRDSYKFAIYNRYTNDNLLKYNFFYEKTRGIEDRFGFGFQMDLNDFMTIRNETRKTGGKSVNSFGLEIDKIFNLANIEQKKFSRIENGWVYGKVFVDYNDNGLYDPEIDKVAVSTVNLNGRKQDTDEEGNFYFGDYYPQIPVYLSADPKNPLYKNKTDRYLVKGLAASGVELNIPLKIVKILTGNIKFKTSELRNNLLETLFIKIYDVNTRKEIMNAIPERDGFFIIENLTSGKYLISLESINKVHPILLQQEINLSNEKNMDEIEFMIEKGEVNEENKMASMYTTVLSFNN